MADYKNLQELYNSNGYIHLKKIEKTTYNYIELENFESILLKKSNEENLKKLPGYLMGNLNFFLENLDLMYGINFKEEINMILKILNEDLNIMKSLVVET